MGFMNKIFFAIGKSVADRPISTILTSLIFIVVGSLGFINLTLESDAQSLWVPKDSRPNLQQNYFQKKFGAFFRTNQLIFRPKDNSEQDIFDKRYLALIELVQGTIQNKTFTYKGMDAELSQFCYRPISDKGCLITSPMQYFHMNITALKESPPVKDVARCITPLFSNSRTCFDSIGVPVIPDVVFGKKSCENSHSSSTCTPCSVKANALFVTFLLNNNDYTNPSAAAWEKQVYEATVKDFNNYFNGNKDIAGNAFHQKIQKYITQFHNATLGEIVPLQVDYLAERSISDQLEEQNSQNAFIVIVSYGLMFIYISISLGFCPSFVHQRFLLGLGGILIVISSLLVAIGIILYAGYSLSLISTQVVPFLILAIGVDNMFIIARAERQAPKEIVRIQDRIAYGMGRIGPSIFTAAFCEFLAFIIGMLTDVPALSQFCLVAALAVVVDFILQITTFVAVLTLDGRRIKQNRLDICPCFQRSRVIGHRKEWVKTCFKKWYIPCISHIASKVIVIIVAIGLFTLGVFGCLYIGLGMNQLVDLIQDSDTYNYFEGLDKYGEAGPPAYVVFKNLNYTDQNNLDQLDQINDGLSLLKDTVVPPVFSWVQPFSQYINPGGQWAEQCKSADVQGLGFDEQMKKFVQIKVDSACCQNYGVCGEQYVGDIVFDDKDRVMTTRFRFQHTALKTQTDYIKGLTQTQAVADEYKHSFSQRTDMVDEDDFDKDSSVFTYSLFYVYFAQYTYIRGVMAQNILISMAAIILAIEIITNWKIALFVTITVFLTSFNLIGFMYLLNEMVGGFQAEFNAVFVVNIVMCMGLAVEFCAHIAIAFLKCQGTRQERAKKALENMGSAVLVGIASTKLIGVIVLGFAPSNIFRLYYFRMYLLIILLGVFNGLMLLPTMLSFFGPAPELSLDVQAPKGGKSLLDGSDLDRSDNGSIINNKY